jgi:hypothetical protein
MELGAAVVREVAKLGAAAPASVTYDEASGLVRVALPPSAAPAGGEASSSGRREFWLPPAVVRRNDTSAKSIDEWTGAPIREVVPDDVAPQVITPLGNYAVQITWADGFNQVAPFEVLGQLRQYAVPAPAAAGSKVEASIGGVLAAAEIGG